MEWFNLTRYSVEQHLLFGVAASFWIVAYIILIKDGFKHKYVGIPIGAVAANFAWEMLWSKVFYTDMGLFFVWGYRFWFVLDIIIVYLIFKHGAKQIDNDNQKKLFKPLFILGWIGWLAGIYFFTSQYIDPIGAVSAYLVNANMSFLYITLLLRQSKQTVNTLRYDVAWYKMLGTALTTVFCYWSYPDQQFMLFMSAFTFILDMVYIYLLYKYKRKYNQLATA